MPAKRELSPEEIQEIISLRGVESAASIRKRFGIGTSRLYRIWKNAEKEREAAAEAAPAKAEEAEEDRGLAAVLSELKILHGKMDLILEGQEIHFEDLEDLEEQLGKAQKAQKGILDTIEESSNAIREKTDKFVSAGNATKAAACSLLEALLIVFSIWGSVWLGYRIARNPRAQERISPVCSRQRKRSRRSQWCRTKQRRPQQQQRHLRGVSATWSRRPVNSHWAPHPASGKQGQGELPRPSMLARVPGDKALEWGHWRNAPLVAVGVCGNVVLCLEKRAPPGTNRQMFSWACGPRCLCAPMSLCPYASVWMPSSNIQRLESKGESVVLWRCTVKIWWSILRNMSIPCL